MNGILNEYNIIQNWIELLQSYFIDEKDKLVKLTD